MQWRVIKMGSDLFDILHTYSLGIVVASATQQLVTVQEEGCSYTLSSLCTALPKVGPDLLDELFLMSSPEEVLLEDRDHREKRLRLYSVLEVQEVFAIMESSHHTPLSTVLERKDGTMRFGHALRQLREKKGVSQVEDAELSLDPDQAQVQNTSDEIADTNTVDV